MSVNTIKLWIGLILILFLGAVSGSSAVASAKESVDTSTKDFYSDYDKLMQEAKTDDYFVKFNDPAYQSAIDERVNSVQSGLTRIDIYVQRAIAEGETQLPETKPLANFSEINRLKTFENYLFVLEEQRAVVQKALDTAKRAQAKLEGIFKLNAWTFLFKQFGPTVFTPMAFNNVSGAVTEILTTITGQFITTPGQKAKKSQTVARLKQLADDPAIVELEAAINEARQSAEKNQGLSDSDILIMQKKLITGYTKLITNYTEIIKILDEQIREGWEALEARKAMQKDFERRIHDSLKKSKWYGKQFGDDINAARERAAIKERTPAASISIPPVSGGRAYPVSEPDKQRVKQIMEANERIFKEIAGLLKTPYKNLLSIIRERSKYNKDTHLDYYHLAAEKQSSFSADIKDADFGESVKSSMFALSRTGYLNDHTIKEPAQAALDRTTPERLRAINDIRKALVADSSYFTGFVLNVDSDLAASLQDNQAMIASVKQKAAAVQMTGFTSSDTYIKERLTGIQNGVAAREKAALADEYKWKQLLTEKKLVAESFTDDLANISEYVDLANKVKTSLTQFLSDYSGLLSLKVEMSALGRQRKILAFLDKGQEFDAKLSGLQESIDSLAKELKISDTLGPKWVKKWAVYHYDEYFDEVLGYIQNKIEETGYFAAPEREKIEKFYKSGYVERTDDAARGGRSGFVRSVISAKYLKMPIDKIKADLATFRNDRQTLERIAQETNTTLGLIKADYATKAYGAYKEKVARLCYALSGRMEAEIEPYARLIGDLADELAVLEGRAAEEREQIRIRDENLARAEQEAENRNRITTQQSALEFKALKTKELVRDMKTLKRYFDAAIGRNNINLARSLYLGALDRKNQSIQNKAEADDIYAYLAGQEPSGATAAVMANYRGIGDNDFKARNIFDTIFSALSSFVPDLSNLRETAGNIGEDFNLEDLLAGRGPLAAGSGISHGTETMATGDNFDFSSGGVTANANAADFFFAVGDAFRVEFSDRSAIRDTGADFSVAPSLTPDVDIQAAIGPGHYYAVLTLEGGYGKIKVVSAAADSVTIEWWYQPSGNQF